MATAKLFLRERDPSIGERESVPVPGFSGMNWRNRRVIGLTRFIRPWIMYTGRHFFFLPIHMYETVNSWSGEFGEKSSRKPSLGGCFYCCWAGAYEPIYPLLLLLDSANFNYSRNPISSSVVLKPLHCCVCVLLYYYSVKCFVPVISISLRWYNSFQKYICWAGRWLIIAAQRHKKLSERI